MLQWLDKAPPQSFLRVTRVLGRARKDMTTALNAWTDGGGDLIALLLERRGDSNIKLVVGGPNAIMRVVDEKATDLRGPASHAIRAALDDVWSATDRESDSMPALVVWETEGGSLEMVAMLIDPKAFARELS